MSFRHQPKKFNDIAAKVRVYGELRQLIDVAIAAAYIQDQDFYTQANWNAPALMDERTVAVETHHAPEQVETAVNAIWRGNTLCFSRLISCAPFCIYACMVCARIF